MKFYICESKKSYGNKIIRNSKQEFYFKFRYFISLLELEAASCHGYVVPRLKMYLNHLAHGI